MKKIFIAAAFIGAVSFIAGCKSGSGDPKPVLINFMEALNRQDFEGAKKYATAESASILDMTKKMGGKPDSAGKYDINKLEIGDAKIEGDMATIPVKLKEKDLTINYKLKKESGAWKVAFDKSSLMSMGLDAMSNNSDKIMQNDSLKHAMDELKNMNMDSLKSAMDQLKHLNMDSLKDAMQEGMKALDSIKKH